MSREEAESLESSSTATRNSSFQGGVYRLGGHGQPSEAIATASQQQNAQSTNPVVSFTEFLCWNVWHLISSIHKYQFSWFRPLFALLSGRMDCKLMTVHYVLLKILKIGLFFNLLREGWFCFKLKLKYYTHICVYLLTYLSLHSIICNFYSN